MDDVTGLSETERLCQACLVGLTGLHRVTMTSEKNLVWVVGLRSIAGRAVWLDSSPVEQKGTGRKAAKLS